ncbi:Aps2p [Ascoidea rubescens DSM 1968]|uniref:AP complex subunit sigma n=1 Tax=Ascoidea rubescens DSM 1968 TaxID=1344418 RepID=A0A1D2VED2_9ASCO|nr:Adaptor protein complex sigma subunit [Ascoidea rubescens DSM 1968]ODV60044.1 Adaptor protein complex sigma subunit [Ascoidea rubescens DSM 1968]
MAIQYILVMNRQGKIRIAKWYDNKISDDEKFKMKTDIHKLISSRDFKNQSNFVEFQNNKIIYRRYAGLFFIFVVEMTDNELVILESIHLFVEVLDMFFGDVCELDLVFNFYKVYGILDEMFLGGEIEETSKEIIINRIKYCEKLD